MTLLKYPFISVAIVSLGLVIFSFTPVSAQSFSRGDLIKSPERSDVYYVTQDGRRNVFPNERTYFSWFDNFDSVTTISNKELVSYPLGKRMVVKECTYLVKRQLLSSVYLVGEGNVLHKIISESQAMALFGQNWASRIVDVPEVFWLDYEIGSDLVGINPQTGCANDSPSITEPVAPEISHTTYDQTVWPTLATITSDGFGPRIKNGRYDFHRGIDIPDTRGNPVFSIADGTVYQIFHEGKPGNPFTNGGTVVVLKHEADIPISFHGQRHTTYFSYYMHLDEVLLADVAASEKQAVVKGEQIATIGDSGTTDTNHLHIETRLGASCSREYQLSNPDSSCSDAFGDNIIDPHINPLLLLPYTDQDSLSIEILNNTPNKVRITSDQNELDLNTIILTSEGQEYRLDFNLRTGIDPLDRDNNTYADMRMIPSKIFNANSSKYELIIELVNGTPIDDAQAQDIWGK